MTETRQDIVQGQTRVSSEMLQAYPGWLQQRLEWFQDLKFGLFMHWGPYSQWGCIESWPLVEEDTWARPGNLAAWQERDHDLTRFKRDYWALNTSFEPRRFDPLPWAEASARVGMTYAAFTTKHHDGFCMWDTRTTDYRITHPSCPFHSHPSADIVDAVFRTFRQRGFGITCYFSKSDWHSPYYWWPGAPARTRNPNYDTATRPDLWRGFVRFAHAQVEELMSRYGRIDVLWLDGGQVRPPKQDLHMDDLAAMARRHQPGLIIADRTVGGPHENILTPEQRVPEKPLDHPWESCITMGNGWAYRPNDEYKPAGELIHLLIDIVAKGGNLLLNIGPDPDGRFDPAALGRLAEIGDWMQVNGEAIHGTRPVAPYKEGGVCFTRKGDRVYALVMLPPEGSAALREVTLRGLQPADDSTLTLLGHAGPLAWERRGDHAVIHLPATAVEASRHALVLRFTPA